MSYWCSQVFWVCGVLGILIVRTFWVVSCSCCCAEEEEDFLTGYLPCLLVGGSCHSTNAWCIVTLAWKIAVCTSSCITGIHSISPSLGLRLYTGRLSWVGGGGRSELQRSMHLVWCVRAGSLFVPWLSSGDGYCLFLIVHFCMFQKFAAVALFTMLA